MTHTINPLRSILVPVLALAALAALLALAPVAHGQTTTPPTIIGPAGTYVSTMTLPSPGPVSFTGSWTGPQGSYTITLPAGTVVSTSDNAITITWGSAATAPVFPTVPTVTPAPVPTSPVAPAVPAPSTPVAPPTPSAPAPQASAQLSPAIHAANVQAVHPQPASPPTASPPSAGPLNVAFVTDKATTSSLPALQLPLKTSPTIAPALRAINPQNQWTVLDVSDPRVAAWAANVHAAPPPYILVFRPNGDGLSKVEVLPATTDEAGLIAEVKRLAAGGVPK